MNAVISTQPLFQKDVGVLYDGQHLLITPYDIFRESLDANVSSIYPRQSVSSHSVSFQPSLNVTLEHEKLPEMCCNFNDVQVTFTRDGDGVIEISRQGILEYGQRRGELGNTREVTHLIELAANQYCLGNPLVTASIFPSINSLSSFQSTVPVLQERQSLSAKRD